MTNLIVILTLLLGLISSEIYASTELDCISLIKQSTAAINAKDWDAVQKLSQKRLKNCKAYMNDSDTSDAYADLSTSQIYRGQYTEALKSITLCLNNDYLNISCHVMKVDVLFASENFSEVKPYYNKTYKLLISKTEDLHNELKANVQKDYKIDLLNAKINLLQSHKKYLDMLDNKYSNTLKDDDLKK
jgi:hypothetical protein